MPAQFGLLMETGVKPAVFESRVGAAGARSRRASGEIAQPRGSAGGSGDGAPPPLDAADRIPEQPATALSGTPSMLACDAPTGQDCASGSIYLSTSSGSVAT